MNTLKTYLFMGSLHGGGHLTRQQNRGGRRKGLSGAEIRAGETSQHPIHAIWEVDTQCASFQHRCLISKSQ